MTTGTAHDRVAELQSVLEQKSARADEILNSDAVQIDGANVNVDPDAYKEMKALHEEGENIKMLIESTMLGVSVKSASFSGLSKSGWLM